MTTSSPGQRFDLMSYRAPIFRAALACLKDQPLPEADLTRIIDQHGADAFAAFLNQNGLTSIFYLHLSSKEHDSPKLSEVAEVLRPSALHCAGKYLSQKNTLKLIDEALNRENISYAVFKGAHVRESVYPQAWSRSTADLDILVSKRDQYAAIEALKEAGMQYHYNPEVFSHEVALSNSDTFVDLHWHIMRPGRTRVDMTEDLLKGSIRANGYSGMNTTATLFVLLTHPAINKYVCSPDASLVKLLDLYLWIQRPDVERAELLRLLNTAGLRTAAWSTLYLLRLMINDLGEKELLEELQPNTLKKKYIEFWVSRDLPTVFYEHRFIMRAAFGLSLHDKAKDTLRAFTQLTRYRLASKPSDSMDATRDLTQ